MKRPEPKQPAITLHVVLWEGCDDGAQVDVFTGRKAAEQAVIDWLKEYDLDREERAECMRQLKEENWCESPGGRVTCRIEQHPLLVGGASPATWALQHIRASVECLKAAGSSRALARVRGVVNSVEGAVRAETYRQARSA